MSAAARWYVLAADGRATLCRDEHDAKGAVKRFDVEWPRAAPHRAAQLVEVQQPPEICDLMAAADQYARHSSIGYCESLYGTSPSYTAEWTTKIEASRAGLQNAIAAALSAPPAAARVPLTPGRCTYCDGTGDVHTPTGEWRGRCSCEAGKVAAARVPLTDEQIDEAVSWELDELLGHIYEHGTMAEGIKLRARKLARAAIKAASQEGGAA